MIIGRNYGAVLKAVLKKIKPDKKEEEEDKKFINQFVKYIDSLTPKDVQIELAGSTARGTNLSGDRDFDIFLLFSKRYSVKDLGTLGLEWAKKAVGKNKYEIAYAEHPYLRAWINGKEVDIVPSYKIEEISEKITSVDRSPLHAKYISAKITEEQKDEVRLLKQFLKGIGIYGAEGKIQGFSGYLCELLTIKYDSFLNFLDAVAHYHGTPVLYLEEAESEEESKKRFPEAAMIFIDPVDKNRNVAAAVSKTSLSLLIHSARKFLRDPSEKFFFPVSKKFDLKWMKKQLGDRDSEIFAIEFKRPEIVDDILWPQLYKFATKISERAGEHEFPVFDTDVFEKNGKCVILFEFEVFALPRLKKIVGPPLWFEEEVERFIAKHKVTEPLWFEKDRILALGERKFLKTKEFMNEVLKKPAPYGTPPDILKVIKSAKLLDTKGIVKKYPEPLFNYLQKRNIP